jgi:ABC-type multidrug transport system fused ATPase/permease subunit
MFSRVASRALERSLSVGDVAVFGGAAMGLRNSVENGVMGIRSAFQHTLFISHLEEFLRTEPRLHASGGRELAPPHGEVELDGVRFRYPGSESRALDGVSLHIRPGETLAIVGENGSGKSTLLKLLARLYDPDEGSIRFDGVDLRELSLERLHREIAFVFQTFGRYEGSVAENIAFGDWRRLLDDREGVADVARRAGLDALIAALPDGLDTRLGRSFGQVDLSGGQWQAIAVARAFARPPRPILDSRRRPRRRAAQALPAVQGSPAEYHHPRVHRFSTVVADRRGVKRTHRQMRHAPGAAGAGRRTQACALHRRQFDGDG